MPPTAIDRETVLACARAACDTVLRRYPPEDLPPAGRFHYHQGVFLSGLYGLAQFTDDEEYFTYLKAWVDSLVDGYGNITAFNAGQLDDLQPAVLLFPLYQHTGDERYQTALDTVARLLEHFPRNSEGGFWHNASSRNQMWLDGLYMAGPFAARYAVAFGRPSLLRLTVLQAELMEKHTRDPQTGLWCHAWDSEKRQPWANPQTGRSPEFWGRAMGWVGVALLDEMDSLPEGAPERAPLARIVRELLTALVPWQDAESGMWYQIVNKKNEAGNWPETSCTCLYAAALCKAVRMGIVEGRFLGTAAKALRGVFGRLGWHGDRLLIGGICVGTGVGDYAFYCARPQCVNDLHGVGAFLLMCAEAAKTL